MLEKHGRDEVEDSPEEDDDDDMPSSPDDVKESIKRKFLVEMPDDFYDFWDFCKNKNGKHPEGTCIFQNFVLFENYIRNVVLDICVPVVQIRLTKKYYRLMYM